MGDEMGFGDEREARRVLQGGLRSSQCGWVSVCSAQMPSSGTKHGLGVLGGLGGLGNARGAVGTLGTLGLSGFATQQHP